MKRNGLDLVFSLILLAALFLAACQAAAPAVEAEVTLPPVVTEAPPEAVATEAVPLLPGTSRELPEGWLSFTHPTYGYTVAYPAEWEMCENALMRSVLFCVKDATPEGVGPDLRLYVSVLGPGQNENDGQAFGYLSAEAIQGYQGLAVGESQLVEPDAMVPEFFSYTRLPDQTVAGTTAAVIENERVWEAPEEVTDRRVLLVTEGATYVIGIYYETPEDLEAFERILEAFELGQ